MQRARSPQGQFPVGPCWSDAARPMPCDRSVASDDLLQSLRDSLISRLDAIVEEAAASAESLAARRVLAEAEARLGTAPDSKDTPRRTSAGRRGGGSTGVWGVETARMGRARRARARGMHSGSTLRSCMPGHAVCARSALWPRTPARHLWHSRETHTLRTHTLGMALERSQIAPMFAGALQSVTRASERERERESVATKSKRLVAHAFVHVRALTSLKRVLRVQAHLCAWSAPCGCRMYALGVHALRVWAECVVISAHLNR